jgi:hypothetical protein
MRCCYAAVHESARDAVDGSSTGTEVPWMWVPHMALVRHRKIAHGRPLSGANPDIEQTSANG